MRYKPSEKREIIDLVEKSSLPVRRTLDQLGIPKSTFYGRYERYRWGGDDAMMDGQPRSERIRKRISDKVCDAVLALALEKPELSARELALRYIERQGHFASKSSVYRLLKAHVLITSPAFILMKAADELRHPNHVAESAVADRLYLPEGDGLGLVLFVDGAGRLLALRPGLEAVRRHGRRGCQRHARAGDQGQRIGIGKGRAPATTVIGQRPVLRLGGAQGTGSANVVWHIPEVGRITR